MFLSLLLPSWQRVVRTRIGELNTPPRVDICYVTPCKRRLRTFPEIQRYLDTNKMFDLTIDHFTFSKKVNVGVVIDERNLAESGVELPPPSRRGRPPKHARALMTQVIEQTAAAQQQQRMERLGKAETKSLCIEPHDIGNGPSTIRMPVGVAKEAFSSVPVMSTDPVTITTVMNTSNLSSQSDGNPKKTYSLPPPLTQVIDVEAKPSSSSLVGEVKKRVVRKRKSLVSSSYSPSSAPPTLKRPRGRPKGSTNKPKAPNGGWSLGGCDYNNDRCGVICGCGSRYGYNQTGWSWG